MDLGNVKKEEKNLDEDEQELPEKVDRVLSKIQLVVTLPIRRPPPTMSSFVLNVMGSVAPRACAQTKSRTHRSSAANCLRSQSGSACSPSLSSRQTAPLLRGSAVKARAATRAFGGVFAGPQPDTEEEGSALDFPEEYVRAVPSRRPDIFPDLKEPKTPMPKPMPGDPEVPDEEEEEEERKKNPGEPGTNPDEDEDEENPQPKKKEEEDE